MGCCPAFWQAVWEWLGWKKKTNKEVDQPPRAFVVVQEQPIHRINDQAWRTTSMYSSGPVAESSPPPTQGNYYDADALAFRDPRGLVEYSLSPDIMGPEHSPSPEGGYYEVEGSCATPSPGPDHKPSPSSVYIDIPPSLVLPPTPVAILPPDSDGRGWVDVGGWWEDEDDAPSPLEV